MNESVETLLEDGGNKFRDDPAFSALAELANVAMEVVEKTLDDERGTRVFGGVQTQVARNFISLVEALKQGDLLISELNAEHVGAINAYLQTFRTEFRKAIAKNITPASNIETMIDIAQKLLTKISTFFDEAR